VLTSFLLPILQNALTITTVNPSVTALLARTIASANGAIVETGTGTVAGEKETSVNGTPPTANAQTAANATGNVIGNAATGIVSVAAIVRKEDARASTRNVDESHARTIVDAPMGTKRAAPLAVDPAEAVVASVTGGRPNAARPPPWAPSRSISANARQVAGTSMHPVMSSTRPCRRSKLVHNTFFCFDAGRLTLTPFVAL
jgi:hypothetical protein